MEAGIIEYNNYFNNGCNTRDEKISYSDYLDLWIEDYKQNMKYNTVRTYKSIIEKSHEIQDKCNAFVTILDDAKGVEVTDNLLSGIPYGVKEQQNDRVYSVELDEMEMEKPKSKGGKKNDLQH